MAKFVKRLFDLLLALILFIPASLVLLCGIIFVKVVSPESSPIFKQERMGYKNKQFTLYKLRSMTDERDENGELLPNEVRLKKWGKIVRKTNIDELFQIWNIHSFCKDVKFTQIQIFIKATNSKSLYNNASTRCRRCFKMNRIQFSIVAKFFHGFKFTILHQIHNALCCNGRGWNQKKICFNPIPFKFKTSSNGVNPIIQVFAAIIHKV